MNEKEKRRAIERLVLGFFSEIDKTNTNKKKYEEFFASLNDVQFKTWINKFLKSEDENFYLDVMPYKNEPSLKDIEKTAKFLKVPLEERVILPHLGNIKTNTTVPVGYLLIKRHQQILSKKNSIANTITQRNQKTGQVTGKSKAARDTDYDTYSLQTIGAEEALKEIMTARSDDMKAKEDMYYKISQEGFVQSGELNYDKDGKTTLKTIDVIFLGAGIRTDLINNSLVLKITTDKFKK